MSRPEDAAYRPESRKAIRSASERCEVCRTPLATDLAARALSNWTDCAPCEKACTTFRLRAGEDSDPDYVYHELDSGMYHLSLEPINFIPDSRSGKLSFVAELSKAGLIPDPTMTADLFDEPDIARANRSILGPKHRIDQVMEGLSDPDEPMLELMPDPHMNLALAILTAKGELNDAQAHGAPDEVLERFASSNIIYLAGGVRFLTNPELVDEVDAFFREHPIPQSALMLQQALERQRGAVALRARAMPDLESFFGA